MGEAAIPIYDNGTVAGWLSVSREGLYTWFRARLQEREGLSRLWVHGEGRSACLGVPIPEGGELRLNRRLTRAERERLPRRIEYASLGPKPVPQQTPVREETAGETGWTLLPDGSLLNREQGLIALPCAAELQRPGLRILCLKERKYLVFRT